MGQYHRIAIMKETRSRKPNKYGCLPSPKFSAMAMNPFDYGNTYKLMEWGFQGNEFLDTALSQLVRPLNDKKKRLFAVIGDYSEMDSLEIAGPLEDYRYAIRDVHNAIWNDYGFKAMRKKGLERTVNTLEQRLYAVDRVNAEYVAMFDLPEAMDGWDMSINPIAVLCATSNGMGGGDYRGINEDMAGRWAFHDIVVTTEIPNGYDELKPNFHE